MTLDFTQPLALLLLLVLPAFWLIDRVSRTEGGTGRPDEPKTKRSDTQFFVSLFNVANIAPRESIDRVPGQP